MPQKLNVPEAADLLQVSTSHLMKLLENGEIPYVEEGNHRMLLLEEVKQYRENLCELRLKSLEQLTQEAQKLGLGY